MNQKTIWMLVLAGCAAGIVAGTFGAGGGMVLVPLLSALTPLQEQEVFSASLTIIAPICLTTLVVTYLTAELPLESSLPYLLGSAAGGFAAGKWGSKIPSLWLHRILGAFIVWGGIRYLC